MYRHNDEAPSGGPGTLESQSPRTLCITSHGNMLRKSELPESWDTVSGIEVSRFVDQSADDVWTKELTLCGPKS